MASTPDPAAFFRDMLGQWEKMANDFGAKTMKSEEFTRSMGAATAASAMMQQNFAQAAEKAMTAANVPTRRDFDHLAERMVAIEAALARIEAKLGGDTAVRSDKPKPARTRKPPKAKG